MMVGLLNTTLRLLQLIAILYVLSGCTIVVDYGFSLRTYDIDDLGTSNTMSISDKEDYFWLGPEISIDYEFYLLGSSI
ncbi:MAG: hypothetical protein KAH32_03015 [Chlamydiia bacterium]|nr:hypothetical protein [Chlamydiia bacterium]